MIDHDEDRDGPGARGRAGAGAAEPGPAGETAASPTSAGAATAATPPQAPDADRWAPAAATGERSVLPGYRDSDAGTHPPHDSPAYRSTALRRPHERLDRLPLTLTEVTGPWAASERAVRVGDEDLTRQHDGEPLGERIIVHGRVLDGDGRPVPDAVVEVWQANSTGRYRHEGDQHPAPLDPNFTGVGRCVTDAAGRYRFVTIKPAAYPWGNHHNAWRPAHIHFSLLGRAFAQRLVTQMYFPGDPLFDQDPIFGSVRDPAARARLVSALDLDASVPEWALAYRWDVVLRGRDETPPDPDHGA